MKKVKIIGTLLIAIFTIGMTKNVSAKEVYYTTPSGIELSREEYDFLTTFYWSGYPDVMTQAQYDEFVEEDLLNSDVRIKKSEDNKSVLGTANQTRSTSHSTSAKTLQIGAACLPTKCVMSLTATWHVDPYTKSWDVIGAYLHNVALKSFSHTYVSTTTTTAYYNNLQTAYNGIGNSVKLLEDGDDIIISMGFTVYRGGTVFGSYQHAMIDTTLANSQLYNFGLGGAGNVFDFYSTAVGVYDEMNGVDIDV